MISWFQINCNVDVQNFSSSSLIAICQGCSISISTLPLNIPNLNLLSKCKQSPLHPKHGFTSLYNRSGSNREPQTFLHPLYRVTPVSHLEARIISLQFTALICCRKTWDGDDAFWNGRNPVQSSSVCFYALTTSAALCRTSESLPNILSISLNFRQRNMNCNKRFRNGLDTVCVVHFRVIIIFCGATLVLARKGRNFSD